MSKNTDPAWQRILEIKIDDSVQSYTELYAKNYKEVHKYFLREYRDWHEAEDMAQDVFIRVWVSLFEQVDDIEHLDAKKRTFLNYFIKNCIRSIKWNRAVTLDRRIDMIVESAMYVNPNASESPLEQATNNSFSFAGPLSEVRLRHFVEDTKLEFKDDDKIGNALLYIFFGCSHDEAQKKAGLSHGSFYRAYKDAKERFGPIVERHFDVKEYNGTD